MKKSTAEKLVQIANSIGEDIKIYEGYSGRGMFGAKTTGVVCHEGTIQSCLIEGEFSKEEKRELKSLSRDNMGLSMIYY